MLATRRPCRALPCPAQRAGSNFCDSCRNALSPLCREPALAACSAVVLRGFSVSQYSMTSVSKGGCSDSRPRSTPASKHHRRLAARQRQRPKGHLSSGESSCDCYRLRRLPLCKSVAASCSQYTGREACTRDETKSVYCSARQLAGSSNTGHARFFCLLSGFGPVRLSGYALRPAQARSEHPK